MGNPVEKTHSVAASVGSQTGLAFAGYLFTLFAGFPFQIYLARKLGVGGLEVFSLLEGATGLIAGFASFGISQSLVRFIPEHLAHGEHANIRRLLRQGLSVLLVSGAVTGGVALVLSHVLADWWPALQGQIAVVHWMLCLIPLTLLIFFLQQALRSFARMGVIVLWTSLVQLLVKVVTAVVLIRMGFNVLGYVWAVLLSMVVSCLGMGHSLYGIVSALPASQLGGRNSSQDWQRFSRIMYANSLLGVSTQYLDRFLLGLVRGPVGVLYVLQPLAQLPALPLAMLINAVAPLFSTAHAKGDHAQRVNLYHLATDWAVRLSMPLFVFFMMFSRAFLQLYGQDFVNQGQTAFLLLLLATSLNVVTGPLSNLLNLSGQERPLFWLSVQQVVITITGYVLLVPWLGLNGIALSVLICMVYSAVRGFSLTKALSGIPWWHVRYRQWLLPTLLAVVVCFAARLVTPEPAVIGLIAALALTYVAALAGMLWQGLGNDDKELLDHVLGKWRQFRIKLRAR